MAKVLSPASMKRLIGSVPPGDQREFKDKDSALALRVSNRGGDGPKAAWIVVYWANGQGRRYKIGDLGGFVPHPVKTKKITVTAADGSTRKEVRPQDVELTLSNAREIAEIIKGRVLDGRDPQAERTAAERAADEAVTVKALCERFLKDGTRTLKNGASFYRPILEKYVIKRWGKHRADELAEPGKFTALNRWLADLAERAPFRATHVRVSLLRVLNWSVEQKLLATNPLLGLRRPVKKLPSRDRVLSEAELAPLWSALDARPGLTSAAFKLSLLTACRMGEIVSARWSDIRKESLGGAAGWWWTIPGELTKSGEPHRVPLSKQAMEVLERLRCDYTDLGFYKDGAPGPGDPVHVFPVTVTRPKDELKASHLANWGKAASEVKKAAHLSDWRPHDLRRTAATMVAKLGYGTVVPLLLNHSRSATMGVTAVYDRHTYDAEKRKALAAWGARLIQIVLAGKKAAAKAGGPA